MEVLKRYGLLEQVPVAGLAKQREELFTPGRSQPVILAPKSQGLYLVQRIRDEAHRFAITSHRRLRSKQGIASRLDAVPGIGPARRKSLMDHFGSIEDIHSASIEELTAVRGITQELALALKSHLE